MKLPREWTMSQVNKKRKTIEASKSHVNARIDMGEDVAGKGLCPECREEMQPVLANGIPCVCCMNCRIVLPQKSESNAEED